MGVAGSTIDFYALCFVGSFFFRVVIFSARGAIRAQQWVVPARHGIRVPYFTATMLSSHVGYNVDNKYSIKA